VSENGIWAPRAKIKLQGQVTQISTVIPTATQIQKKIFEGNIKHTDRLWQINF